MDSVDDLLQLLRNYYSEDFCPTKQLTFRHDTVKVVIFSEIDTVLILRIERKNRGHSDKVINLVQGLNALCLCPTFPYSYHDRGLTRDKVKNRPDSGTTMSIIVGAIPQTTFIASHMPVDPKHREADTFAKIFLTRHTDEGLVEKVLLSIHDKNFDHDLQYLAMREVALSGLECSAFIEKMKGRVNVSFQKEYKKYSWTKQLTNFLDLKDLPSKTHQAYRRYTDRCYDQFIWHGHHDAVSSSYVFPNFIW
jgi:hypothetical protein